MVSSKEWMKVMRVVVEVGAGRLDLRAVLRRKRKRPRLSGCWEGWPQDGCVFGFLEPSIETFRGPEESHPRVLAKPRLYSIVLFYYRFPTILLDYHASTVPTYEDIFYRYINESTI